MSCAQLNLIPDMPVIIGGLSTKITLLYDHYASRVRRSYEGFRIMEDMGSLVAPRKRRAEINLAARTIYALSSGMMTEGTISNEFARRFVTHPNNAVAFVGYTDPKTPGWRLRHAKPGDLVSLDEKKPPGRSPLPDRELRLQRARVAGDHRGLRPRRAALEGAPGAWRRTGDGLVRPHALRGPSRIGSHPAGTRPGNHALVSGLRARRPSWRRAG